MFRVEELERMNYLNINRSITAGPVFLLLVGSICFALQFFQQGEVVNLLSNELKQITSEEKINWQNIWLLDERLLMS